MKFQPVACPHCGETFRHSCLHANKLAIGSKEAHDAYLADQQRELERWRFRAWLSEDHPARALSILARHAGAQGREVRR